ncbi:MAG: hydantoinase B/oxoprolinase family protein [Ruegeria sp.]
MSTDPVMLALLQKQLDHISRHMGWVMTRTARSPIFSESHDFSCFITDADGNALSVADGIPIHTGGGSFAVAAVLRDYGSQIRDGDVYLLSDPYVAGGNHLPDWTMIRPVFVDGQLMAFVCNRAHQSDIGGAAAGTYNSGATEIYHEGIRLPVMILVEAGRVRDDLWKLLLLNSRCAELLDGDLQAMLGSTTTGAASLASLVVENGPTASLSMFQALLDYGERSMKGVVSSLPQGTYLSEDVSDNDCFKRRPVAVRLQLDITKTGMTFDFTGTDGQIRGFKNSSLANTHSAVYMAVLSFFDADLPRNQGAFRPLKIIAPEGTVVNALPPAPMTMNTVHPTSEIVHACWKALGQARPELACAGWAKQSGSNTCGDADNGETFVLYQWFGSSAGGAVDGRDGFNSVGQLCTLGGMALPNVETYEQIYPIRVIKQEFRCGAAGPGKFRGGTGIHYIADIDVPAEYTFRGEGMHSPTGYGVGGGGYGAHGPGTITPRDGESFTPPQFGVANLGPLRLEVTSSGGGGFGDPADRDPELVLQDVRDEVIAPGDARDVYAVVLNSDTKQIDWDATEQLRDKLRKEQPDDRPSVQAAGQ